MTDRDMGVGVLGLGLLFAALIGVIFGAQAEASSKASTGQAIGKQRHCVATVGSSLSKAPETACFSTFRTAIQDATSGRVKDAPMNASASAADRAAQKRVFAAVGDDTSSSSDGLSTLSVRGDDVVGCCAVLSVEYEDRGFRGNTLTYRGSGGCDNNLDVDLQVGYVGDKWNDEISSYVGSNRCQVKHFQHKNFRSSSTAYKSQDNYMGVFNDETSAKKWR